MELHKVISTNRDLVKDVDYLKETKGDLVKEVDYLKKTNRNLVKEVDDLKAISSAQAKYMVNQLVKNSENSTTTTFRGIGEFLGSDGTRKAGETFHCNGLPWYLRVTHTSKFEGNLGVFLCYDITDFFGYRFLNWSANATFSLTMVNQDAEEKSKTEHFTASRMFERSFIDQTQCHGAPSFVRISDLYGGFVKQDSLKFKVEFKNLEFDLID